eukprot:TRINITY_DN14192_c0_g1_i2.p1 TRINITY_DN14192_c0_g1~~TRINITY_DN14192_c0_g1_i2.p1  ORF type:complete len:246 (-),score=15.64 TRINITY_DN14192_c0_g1_i2:19-756(-)
MQFWGGMLSYYVIFNDFGFTPSGLMGVANKYMIQSNPGDVYNPTHVTFGNTAALAYVNSGTCPTTSDSNYTMIDWVYLDSATYDLRMTALDCSIVNGTPVFTQSITFGTCNVQQISPHTNLPVCYTTEACKYAQTGYLIGVVFCQMANGYACKTRKTSIIYQGTSNTFFHFATTTEIILVILLAYFLPLSISFGFRDVIFKHFGMPTIPFAILVILVDESRKYYIRKLPADDNGKPHWFTRAALW